MKSSRRRKQLRWVVAGTAVAMVTVGSFTLVEGNASAAVTPGTGSAEAQSLQLTPHEGSLAVGAIMGEALAGHTNDFARAQSQGVDLGAVGESLRGYNCDTPPSAQQVALVPEPLQTETGESGASQGQTQTPTSSDDFANEHVLANTVPYGEADTNYAGPFASPGSAFTVSGLATKAWSGLVNGVREAGATSDIKSINIGGAVQLSGLHWSAVYPSGSGAGKPTASFTIGYASINGTQLPDTANLDAVQSAVNSALAALGIEVVLPQAYTATGILFESPMQIEVVPAASRDTVTDGGLNAARPVYYGISDGLENGFDNAPAPYNTVGPVEDKTNPYPDIDGSTLAQELCQSDTPITVADITLAAFSGAGYFNSAFGGVQATSGSLVTNPYSLAALGFGTLSLPGSSQYIAGTPPQPGTPGTSTAVGGGTAATPAPSSPVGASTTTPATTGSAGSATQPIQRASAVGYSAGGPLLGIGLASLAGLGLLAELDRRRMRGAQRTVAFEE